MASSVRNRRRRVGLSTSLVLLLFLVLLPLLGALVLRLVYDRDHAAEDAQALTSEVVSTGAAAIESMVDQSGVLLATVGRTTNPSGVACSAELAAALAPNTRYRNLWAVGEDGTVRCAAVGALLTDDVADTEWFTAVTERDQLTLTAPAEGLASGEPVMVVALPVGPSLDPDELATGRPPAEGVLASSLELWSLVTFAGSFDLSPDSVVEVLDDEGRVLARSPGLPSAFLEVEPIAEELDGREGTFSGRGLDDVQRLWSYRRLESGGQELTVVAGVSRAEVYAQADSDLAGALAVALGLAVVVGTVAVLGARRWVIAPMGRLRSAMTGFRSGEVDRRAGDIGGTRELTDLGDAFDGMADEIERRLADQERLLELLDEASEAERQSIAAGIHDEAVQNLSAIRIRLQLLRRTLDDGAGREDLDRVVALLDETTGQLRGLLFDLRPAEFDRIGLLPALRETVEVRLGDDLEAWTVTGEVGPEVPETVVILLYRVALQALANVREHADADRVDVRLTSGPGMVELEVVDDGRGFDPALVERSDRPGHIGLRVMRDRVRAAGGELVIETAPGAGTSVRARVPLPGSPPLPPEPPAGSRGDQSGPRRAR